MKRPEPHEMSLDRAMVELDELGSAQDPIEYRGKETTMESLSYELEHQTILASELRITYWAMRPKMRQVRNGTLAGMIRDRRKLLTD